VGRHAREYITGSGVDFDSSRMWQFIVRLPQQILPKIVTATPVALAMKMIRALHQLQ